MLLVENERVQGRIRQRVLLRLGRLDQLQACGQLDSLLRSLGRFSNKLAVLDARGRGDSVTTRGIGAALVFERLWAECGIGAVLCDMLRDRRFEFALERAVFMTVLHRLFVSGSDRAAERWMHQQAIVGTEELSLHHLYRTMGFLGEPLHDQPPREAALAGKGESGKELGKAGKASKASKTDRAALVLRTRKDLLEEELFARRRDLFTDVELVFFDTTSIYFEGEGGEQIGRRGHSKDHRPDLKQLVVGMVLDNAGNPVCSTMWPGNTTDVTSLVPVVDRLQRYFGVQRVCIVADRGMVSEPTMTELEARGWFYILGVRMRRSKEAREEVLAHGGRFKTVHPKSADAKAPSPLQVKEVWVRDDEAARRRYVVCLNEDQAKKDALDRSAIIEALNNALGRGDKSLIGNKGFRRFVAGTGERWHVDEAKVAEEARYDGKWVLRTNTDFDTAQVALKYKQLWTVEAIFRTMKSQLHTRPIFHKVDDTIRGHVFCSFLALVLRKALQDRLDAAGHGHLEWNHVIDDLAGLQEIELHVQGKDYRLRTETNGTLAAVFSACGVALPPTLRPM